MSKETIINRFKEEIKERGKDISQFDFEHEWDEDITEFENETIIKDKINSLFGTTEKQMVKESKQNEERNKIEEKKFVREEKERIMILEDRGEMFKEQANVLIVGKKRSGKTCLGWAFLKQFGDYKREMYVYRHPRPDDLSKLPFRVNNLTNLKQVSNLTDAVILIDEAHKVFPIQEKAVNNQLRNILAVSAQNNICFIFVCHNSYFINRSLFSFIDIKIIKEVNEGHFELERPHMKKIYENVCVMGNSQFFIDSDYLRGNETFNRPEWFNEKLSFAYRNEVNEDFFSKVRDNNQNAEMREKSAEQVRQQ